MKIFNIFFMVMISAILSGCTSLTMSAYTMGLREQYVSNVRYKNATDVGAFDVMDASFDYERFGVKRSTSAVERVGTYGLDSSGSFAVGADAVRASPKLIIPVAELKCPTCVQPHRYRKPYGYLGFPLMLVTVPVDVVATIVAVPLAAVGVGVFATVLLANCAAHQDTNCHE